MPAMLRYQIIELVNLCRKKYWKNFVTQNSDTLLECVVYIPIIWNIFFFNKFKINKKFWPKLLKWKKNWLKSEKWIKLFQ